MRRKCVQTFNCFCVFYSIWTRPESRPLSPPDQEWEALQQSIQRRERALLETKSKVTHPAYSLYFPEEKQEWWWLYIADRKDQTLVSMPYHVCTLKDTEEVRPSGFTLKKREEFPSHSRTHGSCINLRLKWMNLGCFVLIMQPLSTITSF